MNPIRQNLPLLILLATLTAFDCLGLDMYLPAFTQMQEDLNVNAHDINLTLSVFVLGLGLGQAFFGPLSDHWGRKKPLVLGMLLMCAAVLIATYTSDFETMLLMRFLQGFGGASGIVISRAIASDIFNEKEAVSVYTFLMQLQCILPILAPVLGAGMLWATGHWRTLFGFILITGLLVTILTITVLPETRPQNKQNDKTNTLTLFQGLTLVASTPRFWLMCLSSCSIYGALFAYLTIAHMVYVDLYGVSTALFTGLFAINSTGLLIGGLISLWLTARFQLFKNIAISFGSHLGIGLILLFISSFVFSQFTPVVSIAIFVYVLSIALVLGPLTTEVMYSVPKSVNGIASAGLGTLQYVLAATAGPIFKFFNVHTIEGVTLVFATFSVISAIAWWVGARLPKIMDNDNNA